MWIDCDKYKTPASIYDYNEEFGNIKGYLDEKSAKVALGKFLRQNIGFTMDALGGLKISAVQEIILRGMLNRNYSMFVGGRGTGKCEVYSKQTKVLTKEYGLISLTDLFPNVEFRDEEYFKDVGNIHFWNGREWALVERMLVQGKKDSLTVTTNRGYSLSGSTNHLIKCLDIETQKIVWKRYYELNVGDYVCIKRDEVEWGEEVLSRDEAYLVGLFIGDGCISQNNNNSAVTSMDDEVCDFCVKYGASKSKSASQAFTLRFKKGFMDPFFEKTQLKRGLSYDKFIPQSVLQSSESLKECLRGIFDCDGGPENGGRIVSLCSTSKTLADQVHSSLSLFGIVSTLKTKKTPSKFGVAYVISISGFNVKLFYERIGFKIKRKQKFYEEIKNIKFNTNLDIVPGAKKFIKNIKSGREFHGSFADEWENKKKTGQKELTYSSLAEVLDLFDRGGIEDEKLNNFNDIFHENFYFDRVKSLEQGSQDCLDFCIPNGEMYWSNGFISHNTYIAAVYCILQCLFEPNTKIIVAGPTFRTSRFIFEYIEKILSSKEATILAEAFGMEISRRADQFQWKVNGGSITAIPLNGEKIRGFRANILLLDEFLLLSEDIITKVLMPFLVAPQNTKERLEVKEIEDRLIKEGLMKEEDRRVFENTSKMIALSSASYTFENLYRTYKDWIEKIQSPERGKASYFVAQVSYEAIPQDMVDHTIIEEARGENSSQATFLREYCAQFTDGSDSYFSAKKMHHCTIEDGHEPTTKIRGESGKEYILGIDPSFSNSPSSDFFAMTVLELGSGGHSATLVHSYAVAGGDLKDHIKYLSYILESFNIVMVIIDSAGYQFIDSYNESEYCHKPLDFFEFKTEKEGLEYSIELEQAKKEYNLESGKICVKQYFSSAFLRRANEYLQACIDHKKVLFASKTSAHDTAFSKAVNQKIDIDKTGFKDVVELIDFQDSWIYQTKKQCTLIEVKMTTQGTQSFDLPASFKRSSSPNKPRKDNYTTLMLSNWAAKCYSDMREHQPENIEATFVPMML